MRAITPRPDLVAQVQNALIDAITSGELAAGDRLTQEELAARLGVSRQPVLQALVLLRDLGLVVHAANGRGIVIAALDADYIANLYELRSALDGAAAAAAARRHERVDAAQGRELLRRGREAMAAGDARHLVKADHDFHRFIYEASDNPLLIDAAARHWPHTRRVMAAHIAHAGSLESVWREHAGMLTAIIAGDVRLAERLSRQHAEQSSQMILGSRQLAESGTLTHTRLPVAAMSAAGRRPRKKPRMPSEAA